MANILKIAHVSTFPDERCGIAFFVSDLIHGMRNLGHSKYCINRLGVPNGEFECTADVNNRDSIKNMIDKINNSDCDMVFVQHEFGIWGPAYGQNIIYFVREVKKPIVTFFHTVLEPGRVHGLQQSIYKYIIKKSSNVITMSKRGAETLKLYYPHNNNILFFEHPIPDIKFSKPNRMSKSIINISSFGFFDPSKGFLQAIEVISDLIKEGYNINYKICGSPNPGNKAHLEHLSACRNFIVNNKISENIEINSNFINRDTQIKLIRDSDIILFPYQEAEQVSSGVLALAMAVGRPIVSTPFNYAVHINENITNLFLSRTMLNPDIKSALKLAIACSSAWGSLSRLTHKSTRKLTWSSFGTFLTENVCIPVKLKSKKPM